MARPAGPGLRPEIRTSPSCAAALHHSIRARRSLIFNFSFAFPRTFLPHIVLSTIVSVRFLSDAPQSRFHQTEPAFITLHNGPGLHLQTTKYGYPRAMFQKYANEVCLS